jgi:hypothetical protein
VNRYFAVYFDRVGGGGPAAPLAPLVSVVSDTDAGQATYRITAPNATYQYQLEASEPAVTLRPTAKPEIAPFE